MEKEKKTLKIYLFVVLAMAIISFIDAILSLVGFGPNAYVIILYIISFFYFFYNATMFFVFMYQRLEHITFVLPLYLVITTILFSTLGIYLASTASITQGALVTMGIISIISSLLEGGFAVYLLERYALIGKETEAQ